MVLQAISCIDFAGQSGSEEAFQLFMPLCFPAILLATCIVCCSCMFVQQPGWKQLGWSKEEENLSEPPGSQTWHSLQKPFYFLPNEMKTNSSRICGKVATPALFSDDITWRLPFQLINAICFVPYSRLGQMVWWSWVALHWTTSSSRQLPKAGRRGCQKVKLPLTKK